MSASKRKASSASALARRQARGRQPTIPPVAWRKEALHDLLSSYGALGYQFGRKHSRGRWRRESAITFFTNRKHDPGQAGDVARIPKWLEWKDGKRRHRLRTDVIQLTEPLTLQTGVLGPGDGVAIGAQVASVGAAVTRPGAGGLLTTAGHLVGDGATGQTVTVSSDTSTERAVVMTSVAQGSMDYALLRPTDDVRCDNLFRHQIRIGPVFNATALDVGTPVMVLDRFGRAVRTYCRGVNAHISSGEVVYAGLITTDPVTEAGQSGGALIDDANRLWGFLIGRFGNVMSVFVPAQAVLDHAGVLLIT